MAHLIRDIRHGLRRLRRTPAFTAFAVAILALGIGATTAVYSVIYALVLRPIDIRDVGRVVNLYHSHPGASIPLTGFSLPDYRDLQAQQTVFSELFAWARFRQVVSGVGPTALVTGEMVGGDYFPLVGARAERGRLLQPRDDRPDAPLVAVVSRAFWADRLGGSPDVVGETLRIKDAPFEIVGVVAPPFRGVMAPNETPTPVWVPLSAAPLLEEATRERLRDREFRWLYAKGRLEPGVSLAEAQAQVAAIAKRLDAAFPIGRDYPPGFRAPGTVSRPWYVMPAASVHVQEQADRTALPLAAAVMTAVGLVLLVVCSNLANLMLARGATRTREVAIRRSLGASRWRVLREDLVESAAIAVAGGGAGLLVARALTLSMTGEFVQVPGTALTLEPRLNLPALDLAAAAGVAALLLFGLLPALRASRADVRTTLHASGSGATPRWRGRRVAIAFQVAVSSVLLALAALAIGDIRAASAHDPGFDYAHLAGASVNFTMTGEAEARGRQVMADVLDAARRSAGVERAALATGLPTGVLYAPFSYLSTPEHGFPDDHFIAAANTITITPGALATMGIPLRRGRAIAQTDTAASAPVAIVSETLARSLFQTADVVGRRILAKRQGSVTDKGPPPVEAFSIVGVAADTDVGVMGRRRKDDGVLYLSYAQHYDPTVAVIVRTAGSPSRLVDTLRQLIGRADPRALVYESGTGVHLAGAENLGSKIIGGLAGVLGGFALVLALAGLYGVLSHVVARRRREIGVRVACGAERTQIAGMVLREGLSPVVMGLVVGLGASVPASRAFQHVAVVPVGLHAGVLALVPVTFLAASVAACYLPARRAARMDPNEALREL